MEEDVLKKSYSKRPLLEMTLQSRRVKEEESLRRVQGSRPGRKKQFRAEKNNPQQKKKR